MDAASAAATTSCPHFDFNPMTPDHEVPPWPILARARREQPVFFMPAMNMWCVTRDEDIREIMRDPKLFKNSGTHIPANPPPSEIADPPGYLHPTMVGIMQADPPYHTRLRALMYQAFTPPRVRRREPQIHQVADALIDEFIGDGELDLIKAYAQPLPIQVISRMLGFPPEAAAHFRRWTDALYGVTGIPGLPHERVVEMWRDLLEMDAYIRELVRERRREPADDIVSDLVNAVGENGEASLDDEELTANILQLIVGGSDTTAILIPQTVRLLLEDRTRWEAVLDDRSLLDNAIEESLRLRGPVRGVFRAATRDCRVGGVDIPEGALIYFMPSSANLDEEVYEDPERFDLHRRMSKDHLAFGRGVHFCLGAALARLEAKVALARLLDRIPSLRMPEQEYRLLPGLVLPAPLELRVEWDA